MYFHALLFRYSISNNSAQIAGHRLTDYNGSIGQGLQSGKRGAQGEKYKNRLARNSNHRIIIDTAVSKSKERKKLILDFPSTASSRPLHGSSSILDYSRWSSRVDLDYSLDWLGETKQRRSTGSTRSRRERESLPFFVSIPSSPKNAKLAESRRVLP